MANVVDDAGIVGGGIVCGDIEHVAVVSGILGHRGQVVGIGEGILGAGISQIFQRFLDGIHLILAVGLGRAV